MTDATRRRARILLLSALALAVAGCLTVARLPPPPPAATEPRADVSGDFAGYRPVSPAVVEQIRQSIREDLLAGSRTAGHAPDSRQPLNVLALSGGGMYGAFDVGVLCGWTAAGTRPTFDVVTGISTGALIATFAFLGPEYDPVLKEAYANASASDVFIKRPVFSVLWSDALNNPEPLRKKIETLVTPAVLREVAREHGRGRRLFVGTTNLDTRSLVVWDMGAIAAAGTPESLELYRKILLASAAVPGFFPPVAIDVEVDGKKYLEIHADGGVTSSVFLRPYMLRLDPDNLAACVGSRMYVLCSGKLQPDPEAVEQNFPGVTLNALTSLLYAMTRKDVMVLYNLSLLSGMDFNLMAVPADEATGDSSLTFDTPTMKRLFERGEAMGRSGKDWRKMPPEIERPETGLPRGGVRFVTPPLPLGLPRPARPRPATAAGAAPIMGANGPANGPSGGPPPTTPEHP